MELIALLKGGDEASYTEIYNRYKGILYQHAYRKLRNQDEVDDVIQELFTNLWIKRELLDFKTNLAGYLYVALRNKIINVIAHKQIQAVYQKL
jgi:DNA-directed RNA polymerase specialized sigma24 family protein